MAGFLTRNPLHRPQFEMTINAMRQARANLLLLPIAGMTQPGDFDHYTRVRCYRHVVRHYPPDTHVLSLLPLAMRMSGPREALLHAIVSKNYGCTHLIVGRDHAGVDSYYNPYDAQKIFDNFSKEEIGINILKYENASYCKDCKNIVFEKNCQHPLERKLNLSGTKVREVIRNKEKLPAEFMRPEVLTLLLKFHF